VSDILIPQILDVDILDCIFQLSSSTEQCINLSLDKKQQAAL